MRCPSVVLLSAVICTIILSMNLSGQESSSNLLARYIRLVENAYGQDQELVNGQQYYERHPLSKGNPYLFEGILQKGSVTLRGVRFEEVLLRYDIHNQQVEVNYSTITGARNQVLLVRDRIDLFSIGSLSFQKTITDDGEEMIFQVAGYGDAVFYIHWEKRLIPVQNDTEFLEEYTAYRSQISVKLNGDLHQVKNLRHLYSLFPEEMQKDMKRILRARGFNLRTANPVEMDVVLKEVSSILNQGSV